MTHETADVQTENVGADTTIWQFCVVLPGAQIGERCNINCHVFIENDVVIGDDVTVKSGVQVWDGITLEDQVFVGPNATFTNDPSPRSKKHPETFDRTVVGHSASIGANATILPGLHIGHHAMIGAGAVLTKDAPPSYCVVRQSGKTSRLYHRRKDYPQSRSRRQGRQPVHTRRRYPCTPMIKFLDLQGINATYADELHDAAQRVIDSGWYLLGEEVESFEDDFSAYVGAEHTIGVGNGLDALRVILRAYKELGVMEDGDEVIVPAKYVHCLYSCDYRQ